MRNDPIFKIVAAIIVAGVLIAIAGPAHTPAAKPTATHVSGEAQ